MGTSNSNAGTKGSGTPLIPSWLEDPVDIGGNQPVNNQPIIPNENPNADPISPPTLVPPIPPPGAADRFTVPRTNFSKFAKSGGRDRGSLGRAISGYISKTGGGPKQTARGMGASRIASGKLISFLTDVSSNGITEALKSLNLTSLVGRPIEEIFLGLSDYICPEGGSVDSGIAREAFIETIVDLATNGVTDLNELNIDQIQTVLELYATNAIEGRIYNEIGNNAIAFSATPQEALAIEQQLRDFIRNGVSDALSEVQDQIVNLSPNKILGFVDGVYERSFAILQILANSESENK